MPDYFKEAKKALSQGEYQQAGDLYVLAGDIESAVDSYTMGGHYANAARLLEKEDDILRAAQYYAQAQNFEKAAHLYTRVEDYKSASQMFERFGDLPRAAETAAKSGDISRAAATAEHAKQWDKAASYYIQLQNYERAAEIYVDLMNRYMKERDAGEFLESVHNAVKKYGNNAGSLYARLKQFERAAKYFEEAENFSKSAETLAQAGQFKKAADMYIRAEDFKSASLMYEKSRNLPKAAELAEKSGDLERAASLAWNSGNPLKAAALLVQLEKFDKAAEIYFKLLIQNIDERAKSQFQESYRANIKKYGTATGSLYHKLKNYAKAAWCYEQGESYAKAAECYLLTNNSAKAGELYYKAQNYEKAYQYLTAPGGPPPDPAIMAEVCFNIKKFQDAGDLFVVVGQKARAAEAYERATNLYKSALLYEETGNVAKAADLYASLSEAAKAAPLYEQAENFPEAAAYYEQAGILDRATECYLKIGEKVHAAILMARQGQIDQAAPVLQEITEDKPEYREACLYLGEFFANAGMESLAIQKFNEVIGTQQLNKGNIDIYYRLAVVLEKLKHPDKAQEIYEKIMLLQMNYADVLSRLQKLKAAAPAEQIWKPPSTEQKKEEHVPGAPLKIQEVPEVPASRAESLIGKKVREYDIIEILGKGGMSTVFRARHIYLKKERAIKIIQTDLADSNFTDRFIQEARILADLHNPHLVQLFEFGTLEGNQFFMVLELIVGESAKQRVQRLGRIAVEESLRILCEAATGLQSAHEKGIIHRDMSPDNLMLVKDQSGNEITKIIDFGIAKASREGTLTQADVFLGKPEYASPEQCGFLEEGKRIDNRADIYSLGITLYYMLAGKNPYFSPTPQGYLVKHISQKPRSLTDELPASERPELLDHLIFRAISADRNERHGSIVEFLSELQSIRTARQAV